MKCLPHNIMLKNMHYKKGQVMLIVIILFLIISMIIVLGIATPILKQVKVSLDTIHSKESYYVAAGTLEDAMYRVKTNKLVSPGDTLTINGYTATISITSASNYRIIDAVANRDGIIRKMEAQVTVGVGAAFNYGIQTGIGGIFMANNAGVTGNVYANGDINGSAGSYITGSAFAADSAALTSDQSNGAAGIPPNTISFGNVSATADVAQSFQISATQQIHHINFYIKKNGIPGNATVRIVADNGGVPSSTTLDSATLGDASGAAAVSASTYGWVTATFTTNIQLTANTVYWVIIDSPSVSASNYYTIAANTSYPNGTAKTGAFAGAWNNTSPTGLDAYFQIYLGGVTATISGVEIGTGAVGDAWANTVNSSKVHGTMYCQSGTTDTNSTGGSISCNTSRSDPAPQGFPISDANIQQWKNEAEAGTVVNGNYSPANNSVIGPLKVTGDMDVTHNITVNGNVWIEGDLHLSNSAIIKLDPGYSANSGVFLIDGTIHVSNNGSFQGSGQEGSYILVVSTSDCPSSVSCGGANAVELLNNAGTVIINAENGTVHFNNNSGAKEVTAYKLIMDNNSNIIYNTGLINMNFTSGPGGAWNITSWQEVQ
jgi:hypothetical protein